MFCSRLRRLSIHNRETQCALPQHAQTCSLSWHSGTHTRSTATSDQPSPSGTKLARTDLDKTISNGQFILIDAVKRQQSVCFSCVHIKHFGLRKVDDVNRHHICSSLSWCVWPECGASGIVWKGICSHSQYTATQSFRQYHLSPTFYLKRHLKYPVFRLL